VYLNGYVGCVVAFLGYEEMAVSQKASLPSAEVELGDIEKSSELSNNMLKIGKHWGIYPGAIYQYTTSNGNHSGIPIILAIRISVL